MSQQNVKIYYNSHIFCNMAKNVLYGIKHVGKDSGNIFETFEASLVEFSNASVKSRIYNISPGGHVFIQFCLKINKHPPMSSINDWTKFEDSQSHLNLECTQGLKMSSHLGNKMANILFFFKSCPLDPEMNTENLKIICRIVLLNWGKVEVNWKKGEKNI